MAEFSRTARRENRRRIATLLARFRVCGRMIRVEREVYASPSSASTSFGMILAFCSVPDGSPHRGFGATCYVFGARVLPAVH